MQVSLSKTIQLKVFAISAFQALQAKQTKNTPLLAESLFVNFEYALKKIINQERGLIKLEINFQRILKYSNKILEYVVNQDRLLEEEQARLVSFCQDYQNKFNEIYRQKTQASQSIDIIIAHIKKQESLLFSQLENSLKKTAKQVIESTQINTNDFNYLANQILNAVQVSIRDFTEKIQTELQQSLDVGLIQIKDFIKLYGNLLLQLRKEMEILGSIHLFDNKTIDIFHQIDHLFKNLNQQKSINLSLSFTTDSKIFIYTNESSGTGTATGAAIGFVLLGPVGGAIGGAIGAAVGNNMKNKKLQENYQQLVMETIEKQLRSLNVHSILDNYVYQYKMQLQKAQMLFIDDVSTTLGNLQNQLTAIHARCETEIIHKRQELSQIRVETEAIINNTQQIFEQLNQITV